MRALSAGKFTLGTSISKPTREVKTRETVGHWDFDTVVSSPGKSKGCLATFIERKTRLYLAFKMPDRTSKSMFSATQIYNSIPKKFSKSFTSGRGTEFACYPLVEDLGIDFYFADTYSSWQRGSNENANGLVGEYFPKKTDLATIREQAGKCLGYKTALEAFLSEL